MNTNDLAQHISTNNSTNNEPDAIAVEATSTEATTSLTAPDKQAEFISSPSTSIFTPSMNMTIFENAQRIANVMSNSNLVPENYRGKSGMPNVMIALELAARIGASPFTVMQNMAIIKGKPSFSSAFLIATINSCGLFERLKFTFVGKEGDDSHGCYAFTNDKDGNELKGSTVTIAMSKKEGWHDKPGSKWPSMPGQMLMFRAASFWSRIYAPDLTMGMHSKDELEDM